MNRLALQEGIWEGQEISEREGGQWKWNRGQALEGDLRTLQALIPDIANDLHSIFEEAVTDSIGKVLPEREARALLRLIGGADLESPCEVYSALDSILRDGSQVLKGAIGKEFRVNVHLLMEKLERGFAADTIPLNGWNPGDRLGA